MSGQQNDGIAPLVEEPSRPSLGALFSRLIEEGEAFIRAEVSLYRAQATRKAFSAGLVVGLVGAAIMLTQALLVAILVGLILILAPRLGMGWAVLSVTVSTVILIIVCVMIGRARVATLLKPEATP
ncbi:phage holin family protein [Sphingomonas sp.]|uniref:phage holin family protein n=1 Tax=Sphingomonas sp. TaxID=28214 RepID=UPI0025FDD66C|nr:phage holin family protein [Sphingomonas sp.]